MAGSWSSPEYRGAQRSVLIDDATRFDGIKALGVDEHVWRHTRDAAGPARLLDTVEGGSQQAFKTWLAEQAETWRARRGRRRGSHHAE